MRHTICCLLLFLFPTVASAQPGKGNRLAYLDELDPYYPSRTFPKLITPQWVGEEGVEAVVILAIDDMRDPKRYENFLRPILNRLKKIDGRAALSIMTNSVDPKDPQLQAWLKEGLSLETHTFDHPCPFFKDGFEKAKATYDKCVDMMHAVPNSKPVAFRMPCCDSLNTPSPRFWAEMFNKTTAKGNFLTLDSSVFNVFTANDPELPRELVLNKDGTERFRKYLPADRSFVNTIEDYPYPYVIGRLCWQFPCVTPSDWQAQHLHKPNNPQTVKDWQAALDCTVIKQGVFCLVFHPHGWIKNEQIVDLIDYAVTKHGKKVKFLNFREAQERLDKNLLGGVPLRDPKTGLDNGVRLLDVNNDGYLDVVIGNGKVRQTRLWSPKGKSWVVADFPFQIVKEGWSIAAGTKVKKPLSLDGGLAFGILRIDGQASFMPQQHFGPGAWHFDGSRWVEDKVLGKGLSLIRTYGETSIEGSNRGIHLRDLDGDGICEAIVCDGHQRDVFKWSAKEKMWKKLPFTVPGDFYLLRIQGYDASARFVDFDGDGHDDIVFSNEKGYGIYLFKDMKTGWSRKVIAGKAGDKNALPMISNKGQNNGFFVHSRSLCWSNENTRLLKAHVDRRYFNDLLTDIDPPALSPQASLKATKARPGFKVELMVSEPLVQSPIAFAWGPDGKLWVVEMGDYPLGVDGKGKPGGKVKYLESSKGDGKYDKMTVFLDHLPFPTGVMPWGKGVLVTCAPDIFYAEATKGTGKADKKVVLYTGFKEGNQQHRVNSLVWGLDNWIYVANGDSGGTIKSLKTGKVINISGRDLRIRPDNGGLDAQTGQTQYGRSRDDWGNWFGNNNSNPMYHFVLADHYLRRNPFFLAPDPRVPVSVMPGVAPVYPISRTLPRFNTPSAANRFTSACSAIVYRDDLFGPAFANNTFVSEPVHNLVHREIMTAKGVTFTSHRAVDELTSEFLASSDNWFRPTMIQTGPDGALWVADMYRYVIEHPEWIPKDWQAKLDLRAGHDKGRIYRVYPVGTKPRAIPRLDKLSTAELVAALDSPSGWQRDLAQMLLVRKKDKAAVPLLEKLAAECKRPLGRLHALCTLDGLHALGGSVLVKAFQDTHPGVRRHAIRLCDYHLLDSMNLGHLLHREQVGPALLELVSDPDPQVRMQLAYTLGEWNDPRAAKALGRLAVESVGDRYLLAAVMSSVTKNNLDGVLLSVVANSKKAAPPAALVDYLLQMGQAHGNPRVMATLLKAVATPEKGKYAGWQFGTLAGLLDSLDQRKSSLAKLEAEGDKDLQATLKQLSGLFDAARATVADAKADRTERLRAVYLLGRGLDKHKEDLKALTKLLSPQTADDLRTAAIATLGKVSDPQVPKLLLDGWKSYGPALRPQVLDILLARPDWLNATLDAIESKQVMPSEVDAARRLRLLEHKTAAVRQRAAKVFAGSVDPNRQKVIDTYRPALALKGDGKQGVQVFTRACSACHQLGGIGHEVGPDLAALRGKSPELLLIAILDPNQAVEARYVNYTATTKAGLIYNGLIANETGTSITLIGADGKKQVILRTDLDELFSTGKSVMPEGLEKDITMQEMADLLAFLREKIPQPKRKVFEGNQPAVIRPEKDGTLKLLASNCEIYGSTLLFEKQYGNLGYWSSADDYAVWTIEVPKAGAYTVWLDWACAKDAAGNAFVLQAPAGRLLGKVKGTGSWDKYQQASVGEITLSAGQQQLILRPEGKIKGAMIDLKAIKLVPK
jgi:putative membrane-bound dehydrogenase-like protein